MVKKRREGRMMSLLQEEGGEPLRVDATVCPRQFQ